MFNFHVTMSDTFFGARGGGEKESNYFTWRLVVGNQVFSMTMSP